jgi:hypothetical protein|nr:MAG TPA: PGDYG protein [Caudoviricetes sp.]
MAKYSKKSVTIEAYQYEGELYLCKTDIFEETYEQVDER